MKELFLIYKFFIIFGVFGLILVVLWIIVGFFKILLILIMVVIGVVIGFYLK